MAKVRLQHRRGTSAQWIAANPVLAAGEMGFETDTGRLKVGNGSTAYASLSWTATIVQAADVETVVDAVDTVTGLFNQTNALYQLQSDNWDSVVTESSILRSLPQRAPVGESLLKQAVLWLDAAHSSAGSQMITNLGWGGLVLDARSGSTMSADSNDPMFLNWTGENYVYLPGVSGNSVTVPDEATLDITGDIDIRARAALDDWTTGSYQHLVYNLSANTGYALIMHNDGRLGIYWGDGATYKVAFSTVVHGVANSAVKWVRATLDVNNGAANHEAKFYLSDDGVTWNQLGTTVTGSGVTAIAASGTPMYLAGNTITTCKFYRAQIFNGIGGTKVLDVDTNVITTGAATTFPALTGQTVTINRSTAGRKSVAVVSPCWLFGTDDYMEVADNALLDFGATESFTVVAVVRQWATQSFKNIVSKIEALAGIYPGWTLYSNSTNAGTYIADGTIGGFDTQDYSTSIMATIVGVRNVSLDNVTTSVNSVTPVPTTDTTTASLSNPFPLRVGRVSGVGATYSDMELVATAVFRRALTSTEIATISNYYAGRVI